MTSTAYYEPNRDITDPTLYSHSPYSNATEDLRSDSEHDPQRENLSIRDLSITLTAALVALGTSFAPQGSASVEIACRVSSFLLSATLISYLWTKLFFPHSRYRRSRDALRRYANLLSLVALAAVAVADFFGEPSFFQLGYSLTLVVAVLVIDQWVAQKIGPAIAGAKLAQIEDETPSPIEKIFGLVLSGLIVAVTLMALLLHGATFSSALAITAGLYLITPFFCAGEFAAMIEQVLLSRLANLGARVRSLGVAVGLAKTLRAVVLDAPAALLPGEILVEELTLIDERIDRRAFEESLSVILSQAHESAYRALYQHLLQISPTVSMLTADYVREYPGRGICGSVQGVEISIGNEEFLIERGVMIEASEIPDPETAADESLLIAVQDGIVARVKIAPRLLLDGRAMVRQVQEEGVQVYLFSEDAQPELDQIGHAIGLELAHISSGVSYDTYRARLQGLAPVALYRNEAGNISVAQDAALILQAGSRDEPHHDNYISLASRDLRHGSSVLHQLRRVERFRERVVLATLALTLVLLVPTSLALISVLIVAMSRALFRAALFLTARYWI